MCGISLVINNDTYATNTDDFMKDAFLAGQVRGTDGAGLMLLDKDGNAVTRKVGLNASAFLDQRDSGTLMNKIPSSRLAIGHVRAATSGWVSADNSHPFKIVRADGTYIIGVHNGTLLGWRSKKDAERFTVDSEWLFHMLATEGHDAFEYFNGAFALVWYDSAHPEHVFMARNAERPLFYMITENGKSILGCSELGMLGWLSDRNKFKFHKDHQQAYYLEPGKIYKFSLQEIGSATVVEYPKYEPNTANVTSKPTELVPLTPATSRYPRHPSDRSSHEWDDYGINNGYIGYYGNEYYDEDGEEIMTAVKEALRKARYSTMGKHNATTPAAMDDTDKSEMVTQDDLETAIMAAVQEHEESKALVAAGESVPWDAPIRSDAIARGELMLKSVHGTSVTEQEKQNAKMLGCFGRVVNFSGSWFDDENNSCMGSYTLIENGVENTYDAEIRFIKRNLAHDLYINRKPGEAELCVVVGVHDTVEWMMCEPLTSEQRTFIEEDVLASAIKQAVH